MASRKKLLNNAGKGLSMRMPRLRLNGSVGILIAAFLFLLMIVVFQGEGFFFEVLGRSPREALKGFKEATAEKNSRKLKRYVAKDFTVLPADYKTSLSEEEIQNRIVNFHPLRQIYDGYTYIMASKDTTITLVRDWNSFLLVWRVKEVKVK
jgi:hypothetical protein